MAEEVFFQCIECAGKLRVRIISHGYNNDANCQFPRALRENGRYFKAPASAVTLAKGSAGTFFYRVKPNNVTVIVEDTDQPITLKKIYADESDETCIVCFEAQRDRVLVPCGHYNMCSACAHEIETTTKKCPYCRSIIVRSVTLDQIQT